MTHYKLLKIKMSEENQCTTMYIFQLQQWTVKTYGNSSFSSSFSQ